MSEKPKSIKERTVLRNIKDEHFPFEFWIKEQVWIEGRRKVQRRKFVFHLRYYDDKYTISHSYLSRLLHDVGHLLLAITNDEHHPNPEV